MVLVDSEGREAAGGSGLWRNRCVHVSEVEVQTGALQAFFYQCVTTMNGMGSVIQRQGRKRCRSRLHHALYMRSAEVNNIQQHQHSIKHRHEE